MPLPCVEPPTLYRPRDPQASALWRLMDQHFPTFQQVYDERYEFWHPHIHTLVTCGAFTPEGEFLEVPELDMDRLHAAWREAVFAMYLAEDKIEPEVVENMRTWGHSGFSVDQSVFLPAGDLAGIQRLMQYMTRCPIRRRASGTHLRGRRHLRGNLLILTDASRPGDGTRILRAAPPDEP